MPRGIYVRKIPKFPDRIPSTRLCEQCGAKFVLKFSKDPKRCCSLKCSHKLRGITQKRNAIKVEVICRGCGKVGLVPYWMRERKFCSPDCYYSHIDKADRKFVPKKEIRLCKTCDNSYEAPKHSDKEYCDYCQHRQPNRNKIGTKKIVSGYMMVYVGAGQPMAHDGWVPEHRLVVSKRIGRPLTKIDIVHHLDRVKLNNVDENLELMTPPYHRACRDCPLSTLSKRVELLVPKFGKGIANDIYNFLREG